MVITLSNIKTYFKVYNEKYFGGVLETPMFKITKTKTTLGTMSWKTRFGEKEYTISISNYYERTEKDYHNTLIHEMIHLYIRQQGIKDTRPHHGKVFDSWCAKINRDGWTLSRCNEPQLEGNCVADTSKVYNVCLCHSIKGYFVFCYDKNYERQYKTYMSTRKHFYSEMVLLFSTSHKDFATLPKCRGGVRGKFVTKERYDEILSSHKIVERVF